MKCRSDLADFSPWPAPKVDRASNALLSARLQPYRCFHALLVAQHGEPHNFADVVVVQPALQPRHAVDGVAIHGNDDVARQDGAVSPGAQSFIDLDSERRTEVAPAAINCGTTRFTVSAGIAKPTPTPLTDCR